MKVLVYGSGGREHTLYWMLKQSNFVNQIDCYAGNGGIDNIVDLSNIEGNFVKIVEFLKKDNYNLLIPGPEEPLVKGIANICKSMNINVFGPDKNGAILEGSKVDAKYFMSDYNIPTAKFEVFDDSRKAKDFVRNNKWARVVKADGLAAGKGVFPCNSLDETIKAIELIMVQRKFKEAGDKIVVEKMLKGREISYIIFTDGNTFKPMLISQDYKRALDNNKGDNTGGMGAYAPVIIDKNLEERIQKEVVIPTINGMNNEGIHYVGALYFGLMITDDSLMLLEYNCRFGDPETEATLPLLKTDLAKIMLACINGNLNDIKVKWENKYSCCVVLASRGYPGDYKNNLDKEIFGLDTIKGRDDIIAFHAGTRKENNRIYTTGGRVLEIVGIGETLKEARDNVYSVIGEENNGIWFKNMHYRTDIGKQGLNY